MEVQEEVLQLCRNCFKDFILNSKSNKSTVADYYMLLTELNILFKINLIALKQTNNPKTKNLLKVP